MSISEITKFDQDKNVSVPSDLRVSLMICDAVMFPSIFKNDMESPTDIHTKAPQPLNFAPEICIAPLKEWFPFFNDEMRFKSYFEEYMDNEIWDQDKNKWDDFQQFCDWTDAYSVKRGQELMQIGSSPSIHDMQGMHMFWNMKNGKIYSFHVNGYQHCYHGYATLYDSFGDYLKAWDCPELQKCYNTFTKDWLEIGEEVILKEKMDDCEVENVNVEVIECAVNACCDEDFGDSRENHMKMYGQKVAEIINNRCF